MDIEPCYEDHPVNWNPDNGYFYDEDVRKLIYWSVFAGAFGATYGCNDVWQYYNSSLYSPVTGARTYWVTAMDFPGAYDMTHLKDLMKSRPLLTRVPDQGMITSDGGFGTDSHMQSTRSSDNSYGFVYMPKSYQSVIVRMDKISGGTVNAWWFNPRTGKTCDQNGNNSGTYFGQYSNSGTRQFTTPSSGPDWVLVLDDSTKGFSPPGTTAPLPPLPDPDPNHSPDPGQDPVLPDLKVSPNPFVPGTGNMRTR